jgi:hypothetical protein
MPHPIIRLPTLRVLLLDQRELDVALARNQGDIRTPTLNLGVEYLFLCSDS